MSAGTDALHVYSTGLDDSEKITMIITFSTPIAGDISFDLYNMCEAASGAGQLMEMYAETSDGYVVIPDITDNGTPSWEIEGPGYVDGNAASTTGTNDQVGVNFRSVENISCHCH